MDKRMSMNLGESWSELKRNSKIKLQKGILEAVGASYYRCVCISVYILRVLLVTKIKVLKVLFPLTVTSVTKGCI